MRVTQGLEQAQFLTSINQLESKISQTQNQISTGLSFTTASQNPVGAGLVSDYNQVLAQSQQYTTNGNSAQGGLNTEDTALTQVQNALQSLRDLALAGQQRARVSAQDRSAIAAQATQIQDTPAVARQHPGRQRQLHLRRLRDPNTTVRLERDRRHLRGDQGQRQVQIAAGQTVAVGDNGDLVFNQIKTGNGTFTRDRRRRQYRHGRPRRHHGRRTAALTAAGTYLDQFHGAERLPGASNSANAVVTSGHLHRRPGHRVQRRAGDAVGQPAAGDSFSVAPSTNQSIFTTVQNLVTALQAGPRAPGGAGAAQ